MGTVIEEQSIEERVADLERVVGELQVLADEVRQLVGESRSR